PVFVIELRPELGELDERRGPRARQLGAVRALLEVARDAFHVVARARVPEERGPRRSVRRVGPHGGLEVAPRLAGVDGREELAGDDVLARAKGGITGELREALAAVDRELHIVGLLRQARELAHDRLVLGEEPDEALVRLERGLHVAELGLEDLAEAPPAL